MNADSAGDEEQVADLDLCAVLDPLDRGPVDAGVMGQLFLGHVGVQPGVADA